MRVLELFAGYGSQALALENLGINFISDISEIDPYAIKAYNQIHGDTHNWGDITQIDETKLPYYDLITYSSPCQDFSVAGLGRGGDVGSGTRSSLLWECERIIRAVKPKYLLMENVKNLVNEKHKHNFIRWLRVLEMMGYWNFWQVLNAKDYGVPQNRERVFVVSILGGGQYLFPNKIKLEKRLKDILEPQVDEKYYLSDKMINGFLAKIEKNQNGFSREINIRNENNVASCLTSRMHKMGITDNYIAEPLACASRGRNPENPSDRTVGTPTEQRLEINESGCSNTLTSVQKDNWVIEPLAYDEQNGYIRQDGCVGTLTTDGSSPKHNNRVIEPLHIKEATAKGYAEAYEGDMLHSINQTLKQEGGRVGRQISNTLTTGCNIGVVEANNENAKVINPLKDKTEYGWHFEQEVYDENGLARAVKAGGGSGNIPKVIQVGNIAEEKDWSNPQCGRVYSVEGCSPTLNTMQGGGREPKIVERYRIRKLTPRECWRLMGVKDEQYNKLHDISNTQLYKMAGNSIVVDVLMGIFKNLFLSDEGTSGQLTLF